MKNNNFALIMAGGQGTRFWPYSTASHPKQFLNIVGDESLILQTFKRLKKTVPAENIFIVAHNRYLKTVLDNLPEFKKENFIDEPVAKNTAPCLILANIFLAKRDESAKVLVVPADHFIPDDDIFANQMADAFKMAEKKLIVTFGVKPDTPHTGYGYVRFDPDDDISINDSEFFTALQFKEKPDLKTAESYLESKDYLWNSGMFVYKLSHFKSFLQTYAESYYQDYLGLEQSEIGSDEFITRFSELKADSIDYALMERVNEVKISPVQFRWNDVGSWSSVYDLHDKDNDNNAAEGKSVIIDSQNSMVFSTEKKPVAIIGLDNIIVVNTENGILVSSRDKLQEVKQIKDRL